MNFKINESELDRNAIVLLLRLETLLEILEANGEQGFLIDDTKKLISKVRGE